MTNPAQTQAPLSRTKVLRTFEPDNSTSEAEYKFKRQDGTYEPVKISGDYTVTVAGIMLGSQWLLGDNLTIDWWIIGAGFGPKRGEYVSTGNFDADDQADIKESFETTEVVGFDASVKTTSTQVDVTVDNHWPAMRGFGLCLGYRFWPFLAIRHHLF